MKGVSKFVKYYIVKPISICLLASLVGCGRFTEQFRNDLDLNGDSIPDSTFFVTSTFDGTTKLYVKLSDKDNGYQQAKQIMKGVSEKYYRTSYKFEDYYGRGNLDLVCRKNIDLGSLFSSIPALETYVLHNDGKGNFSEKTLVKRELK